MKQTSGGNTTILLVRHTQVHNPQDILYGRLPRFRLTDLGREQAEVTARVLAEEPIGAFYTSPRLRARQTGRILAAPHPDAAVRVTRLLDEVLTSWQGRPHSDLEVHGFDFYGHPLHETDETLEQVWRRVEQFVSRARRRHVGDTIVGVTHGDLAMVARAAYLSMPLTIASLRLPNIYPGHGSITRLVFPADPREMLPLSVEYYDPNSQGESWSQGWVRAELMRKT
ncbi:MAG: histidine phosphatase family protein [Chloroflexia bacterium]